MWLCVCVRAMCGTGNSTVAVVLSGWSVNPYGGGSAGVRSGVLDVRVVSGTRSAVSAVGASSRRLVTSGSPTVLAQPVQVWQTTK